MKNFYFLFTFLLFLSCRETENIKKYYYQLEDFEEPKYYIFHCNDNPEKTDYWKIATHPSKKELTTTVFDYKFELVEYSREKFDEDGSKFIEYYAVVGGHKTRDEIKEDEVFLWEPSSDFTYSMIIHDQYGATEFKKNREYIGKEKIAVMGEEVEAVKMKGEYYFNNGEDEPYQYWQYSYYTKDHAFVKWERHLPNGEILNMEVAEILSEEEWKVLKASSPYNASSDETY